MQRPMNTRVQSHPALPPPIPRPVSSQSNYSSHSSHFSHSSVNYPQNMNNMPNQIVNRQINQGINPGMNQNVNRVYSQQVVHPQFSELPKYMVPPLSSGSRSDVSSYYEEEDDRMSIMTDSTIPTSAHNMAVSRDEEETEDFESDDTRKIKAILKEFLDLENKIEDLSGRLKGLRRKKATLQESIIQFMDDNGLEELKTPKDNIELKEQTRNRYVTSRNLLAMLTQFATEKNIPALKHFLVSTPLHHTTTSSRVRRVKRYDEDD